MKILAQYLSDTSTTQQAFAQLVRVSQPTVNRWLNGASKPSWEKAAEIERATGGRVPVVAWVSPLSSEAS